MKEVKNHYYRSYPPLRLYKDDLEEIVDVFRKNFKEFQIFADKYEIDDLSKLDNINKNKITYFAIKHFRHYDLKMDKSAEMISLEFEKNSARLSLTNENEIDLYGIAARLDTLISSKKCIQGFLSKFWLIIFEILFITGVTCISSFLFLGGLFKYSMLTFVLLIIGSALLLLVGIGSLWISYVNTHKHTIIHLIYSKARTNFFARNKDNIIFALTFGLIGTVLGSVITTLILNSITQCK